MGFPVEYTEWECSSCDGFRLPEFSKLSIRKCTMFTCLREYSVSDLEILHGSREEKFSTFSRISVSKI